MNAGVDTTCFPSRSSVGCTVFSINQPLVCTRYWSIIFSGTTFITTFTKKLTCLFQTRRTRYHSLSVQTTKYACSLHFRLVLCWAKHACQDLACCCFRCSNCMSCGVAKHVVCQMARYCYYIGRIKIVQLHYNEAHDNFQQALRKAPDKAIGFKTIGMRSERWTGRSDSKVRSGRYHNWRCCHTRQAALAVLLLVVRREMEGGGRLVNHPKLNSKQCCARPCFTSHQDVRGGAAAHG